MKRYGLVILGLAIAAISLGAADYIVGNTVDPRGAYGAVQVATASATCFPTTPLGGRTGIELQNLGTEAIYCGFDSSVTTATGHQVPVNGTWGVGVSYNGSLPQGPGVKICCIAPTTLQTTPADTRWAEVR